MKRNAVTRLAMIILMEHDLEAAINFYQKLGLKLVFHVKGQWAELALDGTQLGLCPTEQEPFERHTGVVLQVEDLMELFHELKGQIPFLSDPTQASHGIMVSVKDPSGNIVDLYQPTPEKLKELMHTIQDAACCKGTAKCGQKQQSC